MQTQCSAESLVFERAVGKQVVAAFDGGAITSDGGVLLLRACDQAIGLLDQLTGCFEDRRNQNAIEYPLRVLLGQRVLGMALGYEDLIDHEQLRHDPLIGAMLDRLQAGRKGCALLAGKSTLNRLELFDGDEGARYKQIRPKPECIESLFVDLFIQAHHQAPECITLDLDATDDPLHGQQEGRFFHGYYDSYCYLPLYIFCGRHLLAAKLRRANIDASAGAKDEVARIVAHVRRHWPKTRIVLRADSGFARDELMHWCETNGVDYVFGLARNERLQRAIGAAQQRVQQRQEQTGEACREFVELSWRTLKSWSATRRVVAKAEQLVGKANPRFIVSSLSSSAWPARALYEDLYCQRGEMENRIKECQLDLFADRTSTRLMHSNQLRLWLSSFAYTLLQALRRLALKGTDLAKASAGTIRLKLLKIGAVVTFSVRRIKVALASGCPQQDTFRIACHALQPRPPTAGSG